MRVLALGVHVKMRSAGWWGLCRVKFGRRKIILECDIIGRARALERYTTLYLSDASNSSPITAQSVSAICELDILDYPIHCRSRNPRHPTRSLHATDSATSLHNTMARQNPNIVITGTPGVGKTTHAEQLAQATGFQHISVNQIVKDEGYHEGKDEETGSWIVDEDKVRIATGHPIPPKLYHPHH